jgi:formate hydrogenlyase subunit 3/multisubunit Na+/H+ antiporter MnhD subunit
MASISSSPLLSATLWLASIGTVASFVKFSIMLCWSDGDARLHVVAPVLPKLTYLPLILLAGGCVLTGIAGPPLLKLIGFLLSGEYDDTVYSLYSLTNVLSTGMIMGCGIGLYRSLSASEDTA